MRVLIVSQYFFPEVGATQTRMFEFARELAAAGHAVDVLAEFPNHPTGIIPPAYRGRWFELDAGSHPFRIARVWVFARPTKTFWTRLAFYGTFLGLSIVGSLRLPRRYDAVVATSPPLPVALAGAVISRLKRAAFVMDVRDLWPRAAHALGELSKGRFYRAAERLELGLYRRADRITVTTNAFAADIGSRQPGSAAKTSVVPNGTLEALFDPARGDNGVRARLGLDDRFVVAYVGLLGIAQGLGTVLDAAGLLQQRDPGVTFVLVGDGPQKGALQAQARTAGLHNVVFVPQVPLADSGFYLNAADLVVVPLAADPVFEMFVPSKMFDAMASGTPVLLMVDGEARAILEDSKSGVFVPPGSARALADAVCELKAQPDRRGEMGGSGRRYVLQHYRRADQARRFAEIVADAVNRRASGSGDSSGATTSVRNRRVV